MMTLTDNLIDALIMRVKAKRGMENFVFLPAYPPHKVTSPVKSYTVAAENHQTHESVVFIGDKDGTDTNGRLIEAQLKLRVYAPEGSSGSALLRVSAIIADALERADSDGLLREVSLSGIGYDESAHSEYRDISARLQMLLSKGASA